MHRMMVIPRIPRREVQNLAARTRLICAVALAGRLDGPCCRVRDFHHPVDRGGERIAAVPPGRQHELPVAVEVDEGDSLALLARTFLHVTDLFSSVLPVQLDRPPRPVSVHQRAPSVSYYALLFTLAGGYGRLLLPLAFACFGSKEMPSIK